MKIKYIFPDYIWPNFCNKVLYKYFKKINWYDLFDYLSDYRLEKGKYVIRCRMCGQLMAPFIDFMGPKACGWHLVKDIDRWDRKFYICHQCIDHGYNEDSPEWWKKELKRRNNEIIKKIKFYKHSHPWVKIRKDYL